METVVENFSVVDSMPIIAEEPEDASQIIPSSAGNLASSSSHTITSDTLPIITASQQITTTHKISSDTDTSAITSDSLPIITRGQENLAGGQDPTEMLETKPGGEMVNDGMTQIFSSEAGQIITSDHQLMAAEHHIFSEGEIIPDDSSSHIIMNADGSANILHASGEIISENVKAHILSSEGDVITVDGNLLQDTQALHEHVTEVTEDGVDEETEYPTPLLQGIKKEPLEEAESATIQIRVNASAPRKKEAAESPPPSVEVNKTVNELMMNERSTKYTRVDRDDPRCRLHFVKYMKRDGKTIKIWECGICGKEFMHQYTLMRHLPTHTDERNFRCNQCGKAFRQMSTLSQHKATHSASRPYVCAICQKTFSRVSTLISHKKTHTEEKQHRCNFCNKAFHQKGNLKNHLFTHTNERPYKCDVCGRGFNQSSNLQCHKAKSHADGSLSYQYMGDKYKCTYCDQAFARRAQLRQHEEYKHLLHSIRGPLGTRMATGNNTSNSALLRKRKIGNVRIIQLPNGDRTFQEIGSSDVLSKPRRIRPRASWRNGVMIEPIDTKAMHRALAAGRTPFALLKPCKGVPVVVKVQFALGSKHMLVPATANDLRNAGKFTVSSHQSGTKAVQIKVPVVATVIQRIDSDGQVHMDVEAPADDDDDDDDTNTNMDMDSGLAQHQEHDVKPPESPIITSVDDNLSVSQQLIINPVVQASIREPVLEGEEEEEEEETGADLGPGMGEGAEEGDMIIGPMDEGGGTMDFPIDQPATDESGEGINSVDLLATAVNLVSQAHMAKDGMSSMEGMHYLRQINLEEYEAVPPDHAQATHVMNHGHIQQIKMVDDGNTVTMDQANISALMDALQNAGYHLGTGNQQIIINADGNAMVVDQQVQMVINGDMEGVISAEGVVSEPVDPASVSLVVHEVPEGIQPNDSEGAS